VNRPNTNPHTEMRSIYPCDLSHRCMRSGGGENASVRKLENVSITET